MALERGREALVGALPGGQAPVGFVQIRGLVCRCSGAQPGRGAAHVDIGRFLSRAPAGNGLAGLHVGQAQRGRQAHGTQVSGAAQAPAGAVAGDGEVVEILHFLRKFIGVNRVQRLAQRPVVGLVDGLERGRFGRGIAMVVNPHRLDAPGRAGHFKRFNDPLEAVERPRPQVGVDVFVGRRGVDLQVRPLAQAQGANGREAGIEFADEGVPAVEVEQPGAGGDGQGCLARRRVARPLQQLDRLVGRRQAGVDVCGGADDFALQIHGVARHVQGQGGFAVLQEQAVAARGVPQEGVGVGVAADFHVGQLENLPGNGFEPGSQLRRHFVGFVFHDRHGLRDAVLAKHLVEQHLGRERAARKFGAGVVGIAVHVDGQEAPAVFRRGVGNRQGGQAQAGLQEGEGIDDPAGRLGAGDFGQHVGVENKAAPRCDGPADQGAPLGIAQRQQRG